MPKGFFRKFIKGGTKDDYRYYPFPSTLNLVTNFILSNMNIIIHNITYDTQSEFPEIKT